MTTPANDTSQGFSITARAADLKIGDLIAPGFASNYGKRKNSVWVYFTATLDAAIWGAELAAGEARERIYIVEPTGETFDDPNLTDKKFPGNPTQSYRSQSPLRVTGEVANGRAIRPNGLPEMKDNVARSKEQGIEAIE